MRNPWLLLVLLLLPTLAALADGAPEQAAVAGAPVPASVRLKQQLRVHGAEIKRLQRQLSMQESQSRRASERLREQDGEIAQLQRELEAATGNRRAGLSGR